MVNPTSSPYRPNIGKDGLDKTGANRPTRQPRNDNYRKTQHDKRRPEEDEGVEEKDNDALPSPFDLSRNKPKKPEAPQQAKEENLPVEWSEVETPQEPIDRKALPDQKVQQPKTDVMHMDRMREAVISQTSRGKRTEGTMPEEGEVKLSKNSKTKEKPEADSKVNLSDEKTNVGAAQLAVQATGFGSDKASLRGVEEPSSTATIKEIVSHIVDRVQVLREGNKTETTVTLRNPPILEGATLTLIANDNAKKEFNIQFASLTPEAKQFLDTKLSEHSLVQELERKGIIIHQLTTTTQVENPLNIDMGQASREQEQKDQQQRQQQQQQQEQEENP